MKRRHVIFVLAGLAAGLIAVAFGVFRSPEITIIGLTWGVGPLFFGGVLVAVVISGAVRDLQPGVLRYLGGLVLSTVTYVFALIIFFAMTGVAQTWFSKQASGDIVDFHIDVWLGLVAAGTIAASGITLFAFVLTGKWSNSLLLRLLLAGIVTIVVTFIVNFPFHNYWSFFGVLLPLGNALFCYLVGIHIWERLGEAPRMATSA